MNNQKKLIVAFRNFVEKVFLPSLKKTDQQFIEWSRFSQYLTNEFINYEQIYQYIESIANTPTNNLPPFEKRDLPPFKKRNEESLSVNGDSASFNPSKTFGGQRARMMFMKGDMDDMGEKRQGGFDTFGTGSRAEEGRNRNFQTSTQNILPGLQKLCKIFIENQQRIENLVSVPSSPTAKYY